MAVAARSPRWNQSVSVQLLQRTTPTGKAPASYSSTKRTTARATNPPLYGGFMKTLSARQFGCRKALVCSVQ